MVVAGLFPFTEPRPPVDLTVDRRGRGAPHPSGARLHWSGRTLGALEPGHLLTLLMATEHSTFVAGEHASGLTGEGAYLGPLAGQADFAPSTNAGQCSATRSSAQRDLAGGGDGHGYSPLAQVDGALSASADARLAALAMHTPVDLMPSDEWIR